MHDAVTSLTAGVRLRPRSNGEKRGSANGSNAGHPRGTSNRISRARPGGEPNARALQRPGPKRP